MPHIKLRWNKREKDIEVVWEAGYKPFANYILDMFGKEFQEEIKKRGYDLESIKFSINKLNKNEFTENTHKSKE